MKTEREIFHGGTALSEFSCVPHTVYLTDFNTNYPSTGRIDRIAREISAYLICKNNHIRDKKTSREKGVR